jgi:hypothetical protein
MPEFGGNFFPVPWVGRSERPSPEREKGGFDPRESNKCPVFYKTGFFCSAAYAKYEL